MISGIGGSSDMWNQMNIRSTKSKEQIFNRMDQDGNGGIDKNELAAVLEKMSEKTGTTVDTDQLFSQYNSDDDKELSQGGFETKNLMESLRTEASQLGGMQTMSGVMGMGGMGMGGMQGGTPPGPPPDSNQMFKDADTDSSGGVSQDELQALLDKTKSSTGESTDVSELFETYDSDGDGELNADETKSALESLMSSNQDAGGMREMGPMPPPPPDFSRMFQDADTDSDGSIGKSELQAIADKFSNGSTTSPSINIEELLAQNDSDSDGKLDESEAKNALDSLFKALQPDAKTINPEVCERCNQHHLEERDLRHLGERLGLVNLPEIRDGWFTHLCLDICGDPSRVKQGVERCHPRDAQAGECGQRVATGCKGEEGSKDAVDDHPEEERVRAERSTRPRRTRWLQAGRRRGTSRRTRIFLPTERISVLWSVNRREVTLQGYRYDW